MQCDCVRILTRPATRLTDTNNVSKETAFVYDLSSSAPPQQTMAANLRICGEQADLLIIAAFVVH